MDKPSTDSSTSKLVRKSQIPEVLVDSGSKVPYNGKKVGVKLRSLYDARLEYKGQVTGKLYVWNKAGSLVEVDAEDSTILLAKRVGSKQCCGNSLDGNKLFEIYN